MPIVLLQSYCLDDVHFYISTVCIPPEGIKKLQGITGSLADSYLRKYYFSSDCWKQVDSILLKLNPPRRLNELVLNSDPNDVHAQDPEHQARSRAVSKLLKNLQKTYESENHKNRIEIGDPQAPPQSTNGTQQCSEGHVDVGVQKNAATATDLEKEKPGNSAQNTQPAGLIFPQEVRVQIMDRDKFFIELKCIPKEAFPLLDTIGTRCDPADLYYFSKPAHPQVVKAFLTMSQPLHVTSLPNWKSGRGICLGTGATSRRLMSCPGNFACYLYDCERFCVEYNCIPYEALSLFGNLDVRRSGPNCREIMWHFPIVNYAGVLKAMKTYQRIKENPSMRSILEPTFINVVDGSINPANVIYGMTFPIPVHILNASRFYIEYQYIPPCIFVVLLNINSAHNDRARQRFHFENVHYYTIKGIYAQLNPPGVLSYMPGLTMEQWKKLMWPKPPPNHLILEGRAVTLVPKIIQMNQKKQSLNQVEPSVVNSQASVNNLQRLIDQTVTRTDVPQSVPQFQEENSAFASYPIRNAPVIQASAENIPIIQLDINIEVSQPQSLNLSVPNPSRIQVSKTSQTKPVQSPKAVKMESVIPYTEVAVSNDRDGRKTNSVPSTSELSSNHTASTRMSPQNFVELRSKSKSMQPRVLLGGPSPKPNLPEPRNIKNVPGFAIISDMTSDSSFERKSKGVYSVEMKLTFPRPPNNVGPNWGVLLRLVHSIHGVQVLNCDLKVKVTIANNEGVDELTLRKTRGSGFHLNITDHIAWNQENNISLSVEIDPNFADFDSNFSKFIGIVRNMDSNELLEELRQGSRISVENTKEMVRRILKEFRKSGSSTGSSKLPVSLKCPLGKTRIEIPCRSFRCNHCSCFDAANFFNLYAESPNQKCPICTSEISIQDLRIDGFFEMILKDERAENADNDTVMIDSNGNFTIYYSGEQNYCTSDSLTLTHINRTFENKIEEVKWTPFGSGSVDSTVVIPDSAGRKVKHSDDSDSPEPKKQRLEEDLLKEQLKREINPIKGRYVIL